MKKIRKNIPFVAIFFLALFLSACFNIRVIENVGDPDRHFQKAYHQIEEIHQSYPDREGRPHVIHIMIYERSERKIVKVATPLWVIDGCLDWGMEMAERESDFDFGERYDFDLRCIRDLGRIGPGLIVEVEDEENKVLIWLK